MYSIWLVWTIKERVTEIYTWNKHKRCVIFSSSFSALINALLPTSPHFSFVAFSGNSVRALLHWNNWGHGAFYQPLSCVFNHLWRKKQITVAKRWQGTFPFTLEPERAASLNSLNPPLKTNCLIDPTATEALCFPESISQCYDRIYGIRRGVCERACVRTQQQQK